MDADPGLGSLVFLLLLILLYALLTAAETAARTLNKNRLRKQLDNDNPQSEKLLQFAQKLTETPSGLRASLAFVGFLAAGTATLVYGQPLGRMLAGWLSFLSPGLAQGIGIFFVLLVFCFLMLLLGTLLPRRLAGIQVEKTARRLYHLGSTANALFLPLARLAGRTTSALLKLMGIQQQEEIEQLTEDEIRLLVDVGEEKGAIQETEREMIENVFEFNNLTAADAMTHRTDMWAVWVDEGWDEITKMIESTGLSRFPVYQEDLDDIIGTVSTRDFLLNRQKEHPQPLRDILRSARFVPESVRTDVLFRDMQRNKFHMAIVVDEYGGTSGLITMEDLIEEIVGNIYDEYDPQVEQIIHELGEGRYKIAGNVEIEQVNELMDVALPMDEDFDTVGGLVLTELGSIPEADEQPEVEAYGLHFKVLSMAERRIEWLEIRRIPEQQEEEAQDV